MAAARGEFSSRFGFIMAAAGSAVGLGNIWGFPTSTASNGGAAFLFAYLVLAFLLAYPALMAELIIGRHARSNAVTALRTISSSKGGKALALVVGFAGMITVSLILSFYAIVSGWMVAHIFEPIFRVVGMESFADWLTTDGVVRDALFMLFFMALTVTVITAGVKNGIEKWASRLMPLLVGLLLILIVYVLTLEGAMDGLRAYLLPDFSRVIDPSLLVNAMGQAFFSLSLGVGTMLVYASYLGKNENLPATGAQVAMLDVGIAVMAGLLILPAMYVAQHNGVQIYDAAGGLIAGPGLILSVLPSLFDSMGAMGFIVAIAFFVLMTIASLTSSISMLEVPVSYTVETHKVGRTRATLAIGGAVALICLVIVFNFAALFDFVVNLTTVYSQPLLGVFFCIFAGWIWNRNGILAEIRMGYPEVEDSIFWKIWPLYIKVVCPIAILTVYVQSLS